MPENFQFAYPYIAFLAPLPFLVYWLLSAIKNRSSALIYPYFDRASKVFKQKPRKASTVKKKLILMDFHVFDMDFIITCFGVTGTGW